MPDDRGPFDDLAESLHVRGYGELLTVAEIEATIALVIERLVQDGMATAEEAGAMLVSANDRDELSIRSGADVVYLVVGDSLFGANVTDVRARVAGQ
jgi:hypothetical protein